MKPKFIHIPRTGGTSICNAIGKIHIGHSVYNRNFNEFSFCVFRDPVDRFVSAYHHLKYNQSDALDKNDFENYIGDMTIEQFVKQGLSRAIKEQQHFLPQIHWIPQGVNKILVFDYLEEGFNQIYPYLKLSKVNQSIKKEALTGECKYIIETYYKLDKIIYESVLQRRNLSELKVAARS